MYLAENTSQSVSVRLVRLWRTRRARGGLQKFVGKPHWGFSDMLGEQSMGCSLFVMGGLFVAVFFRCGIFVGILVLAAVAAAAFVVLLQEGAEIVLLRLLAYPDGLLLVVEDA